MIDDDGLPILTRVLRTGAGVRVTPPDEPDAVDDADGPDGLSFSPSSIAPLDFPTAPWSRPADAVEPAARTIDAEDDVVIDDAIEAGVSGDRSTDASSRADGSIEPSTAVNEPSIDTPSSIDTAAEPSAPGSFASDDAVGSQSIEERAAGPVVDRSTSDASGVIADIANMPSHEGDAADHVCALPGDGDDAVVGGDAGVDPGLDIVGPAVDLVPPAPDPGAIEAGGPSHDAPPDVAIFDALDVAAFDDASDRSRQTAVDAVVATGAVGPSSNGASAVDATMYDDAAIDIASFASVAVDRVPPEPAASATAPDAVDTPPDGDPAAPTDDADRWNALSERVLTAVLEDLGARVDTEFDARIAQAVHAEIETAVGRLQHALREHVGEAIRDVVARAVEAEVVRHRVPDDATPRD